jgi:hypothetical protein
MRGRGGVRCLAVAGLAIVMASTAGCVGRWRPPADGVVVSTQPQKYSMLAACLRTDRVGRWLYERSALPAQADAPVSLYIRQTTRGRISEGSLEQRHFLPIEQYLEQPPKPSSRPAREDVGASPVAGGRSAETAEERVAPAAEPRRRPRAPLQGGTGIFVRLAEPADPIPPSLESSGRIASSTAITYFDYLGVPQSHGTLQRVTEIEGTEDVDCLAGRFEQCLRIRVDLKVHFPWVAIVDLSTYLWLSPRVGEVRRVQRLSGWFLIFPFASADEYRLVSYTPPPTEKVEAESLPRPRWACAAVLLEGDYPQIRVSGMVVDLAESQPAP